MAIRRCVNKESTGSNNYVASSLTRQWANWIIILVLQAVVASGYWVVLPSMHQFITNPPNELDNDETIRREGNQTLHNILPGLGESEYIYSWIVTAYAFGEIIGAITAGLLTTVLPYHITIFIGCVIHIIAGILYATTVNSIMIFIARFLIGFFGGFAQVLMGGYLGESADNFETKQLKNKAKKEAVHQDQTRYNNHCTKEDHSFNKRKKKRTLKDLLFILYGFAKAIFTALILGIASIIAQFPSIHQFRWPGWFIALLTAVYTVAFVIVFEKPSCVTAAVEDGNSSDSEDVSIDMDKQKPKAKLKSARRIQLSLKPKCCSLQILKQIVAYTFFLFAGYVAGALFAVMDTLINPILQDQFGFTIADISIFILVALLIPIVAAILLSVIKALSIDNRIILAGLLIVAIAGGMTMSDWQAIGNDPCTMVFNGENNASKSSYSLDNKTFETINLNPFLNLSVNEIESLCEATSTSEHTCYWNPRSRITGKYCSDCTQRCNSIQKSLYFAQLCVGFSLSIFVLQITPLFVNIIASDYTPTEYQGVIMGAIYTVAGLARNVSPLWSDWVYETSDKHTYVVMTINSSIIGLVLVLLLVLYKYIGPKSLVTRSNISRKKCKSVNHNANYEENSIELLQQSEGHLIATDSDDYTN